MQQTEVCTHCRLAFLSWETPLREPGHAFHPTCFVKHVEERVAAALREAGKK